MHKRYLLLLFALHLALFSVGQTRYFLTPAGATVDSVTYSAQKEQRLARFRKISPKATLSETLTETRRSRDSVVYAASWHIDLNGQPASSSVVLNRPLPMPALTTLDGHPLTLSDLTGKPTLLNLWFTACKPCIDEMPVLNQLKTALGDSVNFVAVTFDDKDKVTRFLQKTPFTFRHVINARAFIDALEINTFPRTLFLDRAGNVVRLESGIPYVVGDDKQLKMGDGKPFEAYLRQLLR